MYSTCLFCNTELGANQAIEHFPVGRRLAFDAAKGRLWVVCRRCERWNLSPLEERWEAIEDCERAFQGTRLRVSTDEIGLARLREGTELVRIGSPQRPEMAAWRYGDQFGRRRRRAWLAGGAVAVATAGYMLAGPAMGLIGGGGMLGVNLLSLGRAIYRTKRKATVALANGQRLLITGDQLDKAEVVWDIDTQRWGLDVTHRVHGGEGAPEWYMYNRGTRSVLAGDDALRAARVLMPAVNETGGSRRSVQGAVTLIESVADPLGVFAKVAYDHARPRRWGTPPSVLLSKLPAEVRLALEMTANEETERRAREGELHLLAAAWQAAEEIAGIADDLLLPPSVDARLRRLKDGTPD